MTGSYYRRIPDSIIDTAANCTENSGMMTHEYRIRFGTVDWHHPQWLGDFYPDDLPADWWLPYYGNEFPVVSVPEASWHEDPAAQIDEWQDNSDEHFRFIFEWHWKDAEDLRAFCQRLEPIREKTLGVLLQLPWSLCQQPAPLLAVLKEVNQSLPLCLEIFESDMSTPRLQIDFNDPGFARLLHETGVGCCWHGVEAGAEHFFNQRGLALTRIMQATPDSQQLRQVLEVCSARIQLHDAMVVIFAGQPPALKTVRDAMVMLELLA